MVGVRTLTGKGWKESPDGLALLDESGQRIGYGDAVVVEVLSADVETAELELRLARPRATRSRSTSGTSARRRSR